MRALISKFQSKLANIKDLVKHKETTLERGTIIASLRSMTNHGLSQLSTNFTPGIVFQLQIGNS